MNDTQNPSRRGPLWMVRAGSGSQYVDRFRDEGLVGVGFHELPEFSPGISQKDLESLYAPSAPRGRVISTVTQVLKFVQTLCEGERVTTYDSDLREYLLGTVVSPPTRLEGDDLTWVRRVDWEEHVARDSLSTTTKNVLGSSLTLFQVGEEAAREMWEASVPLSEPITEVEPPQASTDQDVPGSPEADIALRAEGFVEDRIGRLDWEQLQNLVAGILRAMGYRTETASRGPDRGVDIFASPDGLGLEEPRIFVEVKHRRTTAMGTQEIRSFLGGRQAGDRCLYVSTGGFTKEARYEAERANVPTRLISLPKLRELLLQNYENLDPEVKALVPLKRVYWPTD